jgi:hypothetical protein
MTAATYAPQPGTIDARALAWFAQQSPHAEASTGVIAAALDQPVAIVFRALERVCEHGLVGREKRDGLHFWSTSHPVLRPLGAPPPVCADDDIDDAPLVQRVVPAAKSSGVSLVDVPAWSPPKETAMPAQPTVAPPQPTTKPKRPRATPPEFDPLKIELKAGRPLPTSTRGAGPSRYQVLLGRMKPGDSVDLPPAIAKGLISAAKRADVKLASRVLSETVTGVWRLADDE